MNEFDETEEYESLPEEFGGPTKRAKITKIILRVVGWLIFVSVLGVLFWRMCSTSNDPSSISNLIPTKKLANVYSVQKDELEAYYQKLDKFTRGDDNYGYFAVTQSVIIPDAENIQIVLRYNNSTLEYISEDFPELFPTVPDRDADLFDITLVKVIDLTPDDLEDNEKEENLKYERYSPTTSVAEKTSIHNYRRYVFENISCEDAIEVYVNIYFKETVNYDDPAFGIIQIYDSENFRHPYTLTSNDKKVLNDFLTKNG